MQIKSIKLLGCALILGISTSSMGRVADIWYLTLDPADVVLSTLSTPQDVISFDPDDDSTAAVDSLTDPPVQVDGFHRVDDTTFYFSVDTHVELGGLVIAPGDVVFSDDGSLSLAYDASARGLPGGINVDAFAVDGNDDFIFSVDTHVELDGTVFEDADLIGFDGSTHSLLFDASVAGFPDSADVDAVTAFSNDRLAISTDSGGTAGGLVYDHGTVILVDLAGNVLDTRFSASNDAGTPADLIALSAEEIGDTIFMDRFEADN